jgi:hypothetical protein
MCRIHAFKFAIKLVNINQYHSVAKFQFPPKNNTEKSEKIANLIKLNAYQN